MPVLAEPPAAVERALAEPVGSPALRELARGKRSACILICDITRPVPNGLFLPPLIRTLLDAGVPRAGITVLVATGLHRPNEGPELAELVGDPWVLETVTVANHDARADEDHVLLGRTPGARHRGAPRPPLRRGRAQDRHRPGGAALHGRLVGRPQGHRARRRARRDHHHVPQRGLHGAPARGQLRARRQPAARGAARDRRDAGRRAGAQHRDRRPAAPGLRQLRRGGPEPSPGGGVRRGATRGCRSAAGSRPWSPARPATRSTGPTTRP